MKLTNNFSDYVWFSHKLKKRLFFKVLCDVFYFIHEQERNSDKIVFLDDLMISQLLFYNFKR